MSFSSSSLVSFYGKKELRIVVFFLLSFLNTISTRYRKQKTEDVHRLNQCRAKINVLFRCRFEENVSDREEENDSTRSIFTSVDYSSFFSTDCKHNFISRSDFCSDTNITSFRCSTESTILCRTNTSDDIEGRISSSDSNSTTFE